MQYLIHYRLRWLLYHPNVGALLILSGIVTSVAFAIWWFDPSNLANNFSASPNLVDISLYLALTYVVWSQISNEWFYWYTLARIGSNQRPKQLPNNLRVAFCTAFVPGKESYQLLQETLAAMVKCEYPHDTWVLDEGNDMRVKTMCQELGVRHFSRKGVARYNQPQGKYKFKTKAGNYNAWWDIRGSEYDFVAQVDVDFKPRPEFLTETLPYFTDEAIAFVGSPQIYGNVSSSWIARGAAQQAYNFYGPMQQSFNLQNMQLFIGANHVFRVKSHEKINGYSGHVVEDHLTGMRIYCSGQKSHYIAKSLAVGLGPDTWGAYFSQQMRWAYGIIHILVHHSPRLLFKMKPTHAINYFHLQQYYFTGLAQGIGIFLMSLYFFFGINVTDMKLFSLLLFYIPLLLLQLGIFFWGQQYYIEPDHEKGFHLKGKYLSLAAWPIYLWAFFKVVSGKDLTYHVTPKGVDGKSAAIMTLFKPHIILGTITFIGVVAALILGHHAAHLLLLGILNTALMFSFPFQEFLYRVKLGYYKTPTPPLNFDISKISFSNTSTS